MEPTKIVQIENMSAQMLSEKFNSLEQAINVLKSQLAFNESEEYLTIKEVASLIKVSKVTVWAWTNKGILKQYCLGRFVRYKRSEVTKALFYNDSAKTNKR